MNTARRINKNLRIFLKKGVTRGYGFLEYFLAVRRAKIANRLIPAEHRKGRILDIGCGSYPIFLLTSKFVEKFGIDRIENSRSRASRRFTLVNYDIEKGVDFPFQNNFIDVVTMLAVLEHISYPNLKNIFLEIHRVLAPGGIFIITVPSTWSNGLLTIMTKLNLVSNVELAEHKTNLNSLQILSILKKTSFKDVKSGYFELYLNRWFSAKK